jgi:hypothetical protein
MQVCYFIYAAVLAIAILSPLPVFGKTATSNVACSARTPVQDFYINTNGDVTNSGRSREGPVCVQVRYNRLRFNMAINFQTTYSKGPDAGTVLLTGAAPTQQPGGPADELTGKIRPFLIQLVQNAQIVADGVKKLTDLVTFLDANIGPGKAFPEDGFRGKYESLEPALQLSSTLPLQALPTDLTFGTCPTTPPSTPAPGSVLAKLQGYQADPGFYSANKDLVDQTLALANLFRCGGVGETELTKNIAILKFWDERLRELGLQNNMSHAQLQQVSVADFFLDSTQLNCPNIFNQSSSTAASMTVLDESPTLSGNFTTPSPHQNQNFFTLTCASPFAVSAGIEFSTIPSREFAIIKSAGGANNTSINKFGLTSDSAVHPLPVALAHVRLWESMDHRFALHASAGASGNIQGQNSGGSSAEFLTGASLSFFRTMFLTAGLHIGTESSLAGGFKVGEIVPSDISSVQVSKSYTKGVGIAITFTKP